MADMERIAELIESGEIRTYADGFGAWHAVVRLSYAFPMGVAKQAIRCELQARAPRGHVVPMPSVIRISNTDTHVTYRER
jgi:hypothetical protein